MINDGAMAMDASAIEIIARLILLSIRFIL
jgi:hypothetical protein